MPTQNELFDLQFPEIEDGKVCVKCGIKKPINKFSIANGGSYRRTDCVDCRTKQASTIKELRKIHPPPDEETHRCPICNRSSKELNRLNHASVFVLDHCHDTGTFRGWLCDPCNRGLGGLGDDVERLKKAIDYLSSKN